MTNVRDEVEAVLRAWDAYEVKRGGDPVIDFDLLPGGPDPEPAADRLGVYRRLAELRGDAEGPVRERVDADLAYLGALLGERPPLDEYVRATQGCGAVGWSPEYVEERRRVAVAALAEVGVAWGPEANAELRRVEGLLDVADAPDAIRGAVAELEPAVRELTGSDAPYRLTVETAEVEAYWAFWLDGAGRDVRLRLNLPNVEFTRAGARQFALHEVLGHGLQSASLHARAADAPWVRLLSVHALQQVMLEGLAQAWPLFVTPDDAVLAARIRLDHYVQLVRARAHLDINAGTPVLDVAGRMRAAVPWWGDDRVAAQLADRGANPLLRSYLWAYPAGVDWFVSLAEKGGEATGNVLRTAYREPLTPAGLAALWPEGPRIGG
ncbi:hypothetical protein ACFQU9_35845 [Actinomadura namibiensis]|uniref:DUF885 domain-containing protein n=1 Tax=Actinomadura namibiensis TaxID=182080 RepID=A0A7W3LWP3_ACTNM|nr:hypothetical protein [Actinomadura namibiensis]MBA8955699.1 hypothetical protein [Actinomadura namibiensis]